MLESTLSHKSTGLVGWKAIYNQFGGIIYVDALNIAFVKESPKSPVKHCILEVNPNGGNIFKPYKGSIADLIAKYYNADKVAAIKVVNEATAYLEEVVVANINDEAYIANGYGITTVLTKSSLSSNLKQSLRLMETGKKAKGMGSLVTDALLRAGYVIRAQVLNFKNGKHHTAGYILDDDSEWLILDYTARQFDESAPFPLLVGKENWLAWVEAYMLTRYFTTVTNRIIK